MLNYKDSVAMYLRKSRMDPDDEDISETLARHEDTLTKLAINTGLNITGTYKEVVSGDGLFTRPQMVQLLQDVGQNKYTGVVCMEIDRLGRSSQRDSGTIFETLKEHEVAIITPCKTYDLTDDMDETSVEMQSFIARQELKSIKRRLRKGIEKTCEQGGHIAEPPYGYRRTYIDKRPTLKICEEEAKIVKMIFDMYVYQHIGGYTIANELNRLGFHPRKSDRFSRNTIKFILENPTYAGTVIWNKYRHIRPKFPGDKNKQILNDETKWIVSEGIHPAIVSQEVWDEAQRIRKSRAHPSARRDELKNPYAGLIYCKHCGLTMQRQFSKVSGDRMLCTQTGCNRSIQTAYIDNYVKMFLTQALSSCRSTDTNKINDDVSKQAETVRSIISDLNRKLSMLKSQKARTHDFLEQGIYDVPTFMTRNKELTDQMNNVTVSLEQNQTKLSDLQSLPPVRKTIPVLKTLLLNYDDLSAAEKNILLKSIISRMTYSRTDKHKKGEFELDIDFKYTI